MLTFFSHIERHDLEQDVEVFADYEPATDGTYDDPPTPLQCEVTSVMLDGVDVLGELSEGELDRLTDEAIERAEMEVEPV